MYVCIILNSPDPLKVLLLLGCYVFKWVTRKFTITSNETTSKKVARFLLFLNVATPFNLFGKKAPKATAGLRAGVKMKKSLALQRFYRLTRS